MRRPRSLDYQLVERCEKNAWSKQCPLDERIETPQRNAGDVHFEKTEMIKKDLRYDRLTFILFKFSKLKLKLDRHMA